MSARKNIDWDAQPLGRELDTATAARVGCTKEAVGQARKARGIHALRGLSRRLTPAQRAALLPMLGTKTDREIAALTGHSFAQVAASRRVAGVTGTRFQWEHEALGSMPDSHLGAVLGADNSQVSRARRRLGLPKFTIKHCCPCGVTFETPWLRSRFCSTSCQRYHWRIVNVDGQAPEIADLSLALRRLKRTAARKPQEKQSCRGTRQPIC